MNYWSQPGSNLRNRKEGQAHVLCSALALSILCHQNKDGPAHTPLASTRTQPMGQEIKVPMDPSPTQDKGLLISVQPDGPTAALLQ